MPPLNLIPALEVISMCLRARFYAFESEDRRIPPGEITHLRYNLTADKILMAAKEAGKVFRGPASFFSFLEKAINVLPVC